MRFLPLVIIALLFACFGVIRWCLSKKKFQNNISIKIIKQPKAYLWLSAVGILIYIGVSLLFLLLPDSAYEGGHIPALVAFIVLTLISGIPLLLLLVFVLNWRITVEEESFTYRNMFRQIKIYHYADVTIEEKKASTRFYQGKKRIVTVSFLIENYDILQIAVRKYQRTHRKKN